MSAATVTLATPPDQSLYVVTLAGAILRCKGLTTILRQGNPAIRGFEEFQ